MPVNREPRSLLWPALLVPVLCIVLFAAKMAMPDAIMANDQQRPAAYALDALTNGNRIVQEDDTGDVMSKPPFSTWVIVLTSAVMSGGELTTTSLYLHCLLFTLLSVIILTKAGEKHFGPTAGILAAATLVLSPAGDAQLSLNRSDTVFAGLVVAAAMLAFHGWRTGRGWIAFWCVAALATLTKGPLGLLLGALGLSAVFWEGKGAGGRIVRPVPQLTGLGIYLVLCGGWFALAWFEFGDRLIDKMIRRELVGHAVGGEDDDSSIPFSRIYVPTLYLLATFAPWSLFTLRGVYRAIRSPAAREDERALERFATCWLLGGLLLFGASTHQRHLHLWPLVPPAALLAGRELARLLKNVSAMGLYARIAAAGVIALVGFPVYHLAELKRDEELIESRQVREIAADLMDQFGPAFPFVHQNPPYGVQFHLGTMIPRVTRAEVVELLSGEEAAYVLTRQLSKVRAETGNVQLYELGAWELEKHDELYLVSNRETATPCPDSIVFRDGGLEVRAHGVCPSVRPYATRHFVVWNSKWSIEVANRGESAITRVFEIETPSDLRSELVELEPGENWSASSP